MRTGQHTYEPAGLTSGHTHAITPGIVLPTGTLAAGAKPDFSQLGVVTPSGDLARDLKDGKRVLLRRGQPCVQVRAMPDLGERVIRFIASTDGIKRDGNRVRNEKGSWDFANFKKNPRMLWCHDYGSSDRPPMPPIGTWVNWFIDGEKRLIMDGRFARWDFAELVYQLYLDGDMDCVSIGWTPLEYQPIEDAEGRFVGWDFIRNELLECSAVPIPADPDATQVEASAERGIAAAIRRGLIPEGLVGAFTTDPKRDMGMAYRLDSRSPVTESAAPVSAVVSEEAPADQGVVPAAAEVVSASVSASEDADSRDAATEMTKDAEQATLEALGATVLPPLQVGPDGEVVISDELRAALKEFAAKVKRSASDPDASKLTDSLDPAYDRVRGAFSALCDPVDSLYYACAALSSENQGYYMIDPADAVLRNVNRIQAIAQDLIDHAQAIAEIVKPVDAAEDTYAGAAPAGEARASKKYSQKRYETVKSLHACATDVMTHAQTLMDEADEERHEGGTAPEDQEKDEERSTSAPTVPAEPQAAAAPAPEADAGTDELAQLRARLERSLGRLAELRAGKAAPAPAKVATEPDELAELRVRIEKLIERKERARRAAQRLVPTS